MNYYYYYYFYLANGSFFQYFSTQTAHDAAAYFSDLKGLFYGKYSFIFKFQNKY